MEQKTKVLAENGKQEMQITRNFDLPVELLFKAYVEAEFVSQWMGTKVLKLESRKYGAYEFETSDPKGNVVFRASGVIHECIQNKKIVRTFEMGGAPFGVQLEIYTFESLGDNASRLSMHTIYESVEKRDQVLMLPFAQGLSMAHDRIQEITGKLK